MARVGIIGGEAFGTAMACVLPRSRHDIVMWAREPEVVAAISDAHENTTFLPDVRLDPAIVATANLPTAARDRDFILMAVPAQHFRGVASRLRHVLDRGGRRARDAARRRHADHVGGERSIERGAALVEVIAPLLTRWHIAK